MGERHLKLRVRQDGRGFEAIGFEMSDEYPLDGKTINMVFTPDLNRSQGYESIQLRIIDLEETDQATKIPFPPAP